MKILIAIIAAAVLLPVIAQAQSAGNEQALKKGAVLTGQGESTVMLCRSRDKYKELQNAEELDRTGQINASKNNQQVYNVPAGTKVRVINYDPDYCKVRILEGDFKNKTAWIATEYLKPADPPKEEKKDVDDDDDDDTE